MNRLSYRAAEYRCGPRPPRSDPAPQRVDRMDVVEMQLPRDRCSAAPHRDCSRLSPPARWSIETKVVADASSVRLPR